jgi:hypothetical protein
MRPYVVNHQIRLGMRCVSTGGIRACEGYTDVGIVFLRSNVGVIRRHMVKQSGTL